MRLFFVSLSCCTLLFVTSCSRGSNNRSVAAPNSESELNVEQTNNGRGATADAPSAKGGKANADHRDTQSDLTDTFAKSDAAQNDNVAVERKIIRNATLSIEADNPAVAQQQISSLAEGKGGFVVTTEAKNYGGNNTSQNGQQVKIVVRVPAAEFENFLTALHGLGGRVLNETRTGQDVTEEYIDLEARIKTQRALEAQFLEIMKQARTVEDALQVQTELAQVRGEIERVEGRRRYLENQTSLSTVTVTLNSPASLLPTSNLTFWQSIKAAVRDGIEIAAGIVLFFIRAAITLMPVILFVFAPLFFVARYFVRRWRRRQQAETILRESAMPPPSVPPTPSYTSAK